MKTKIVFGIILNIIEVYTEYCNASNTQCGGANWKGNTCCESGYECKEINPWYSQCLPSNLNKRKSKLSMIDMSIWKYNSDDDVYYQTDITYCENPADKKYESLAIFVPGAYMKCSEGKDKNYSCETSNKKVNNYSAKTAPIVMPINTPGYSAMSPLSDYSSSVSSYTKEGFIYVHAGCRGRDAGAPAGVTDLKAAVRFLRYCNENIPGNTDRIFTFGMSGGGAQSALMGSTGDSELYEPYLKAIGAVTETSDAIFGSMDWCPITNLDTADESYEWMMGVTRSKLSDDEQAISDALAKSWADYINSAGIKDTKGNVLKLEESSDGIYQAGSYYDYIKGVIEESLNNFLSDTEFPYTVTSKSGGPGGNGGPPSGEKPDEEKGGNIKEKNSSNNSTSTIIKEKSKSKRAIEDEDDITRNETTNGISLSGTYKTVKDYIDALNANTNWVKYDESKNTASITSIKDFVNAFKSASKNLGAFDQLDRGQGENTLFGYGDGKGAHFDSRLSKILSDLKNSYADDYADDLKKKDDVGYTIDQRINIYTPLYYLLENNEGYGKSTLAKHWRIRTGVAQSDTAVTTEVNLALALQNNKNVSSVDFATIWGAGHTEAERTGTSTENFISWVNNCLNNTSSNTNNNNNDNNNNSNNNNNSESGADSLQSNRFFMVMIAFLSILFYFNI